MTPEQFYLRTFQCRVSIPNPRAIAMEWLCQCESGCYDWVDGELRNVSWMDMGNDYVQLPQAGHAKTIMRASDSFCPLPETVHSAAPINQLPGFLTRDWARHIKEFCNYYLMDVGRYKLMITAHLLNTVPNLHQDNTCAMIANAGEEAWSRWCPFLREAKVKASRFI